MSDFDEGYEEGYEDGSREARNDLEAEMEKAKIDVLAREKLKERYHYLKHGGEWHRELSDHWVSLRENAQQNYAAGFLDAMKTLGVKP